MHTIGSLSKGVGLSFLPFISPPSDLLCLRSSRSKYWAIQAGLLTPLTFARHRLSPLAAFASGAYFLHNGMCRQ